MANPFFVNNPQFNFGGMTPSLGVSPVALHDQTGVATASWMISAGDGYFSSYVDDEELKNFGQLDAFWTRSECATYGHVGTELFSSAAMKQSMIIVRVPFESYIPKFKVAMNDKRNFEQITLLMLTNAGGTMREWKIEYNYKNCKIQTFEQSMDTVRGLYHVDIGFRADAETITAYKITNTGEPEGQLQSITDYTKNTSSEGEEGN